MDDRELAAVVQRLERCQPRVHPEEAVEIDGGISARAGTGYGDARTGRVVGAFAERHDHVQPVDSAALEDGHEDFAPRVRRRNRPRKERRREPEADQRKAAILEKDAS